MVREPLDTLLRLRKLAVQDQIRALAAALRAEDVAHQARAVWADTIVRETTAARSLAGRDPALDGFIEWRARAVEALRGAEAQVAIAAAQAQTERSALGDARGAMRAVELALERRKVTADEAAQRAAQHALDDTSRPCSAHDVT
jgi:hypothetical protein